MDELFPSMLGRHLVVARCVYDSQEHCELLQSFGGKGSNPYWLTVAKTTHARKYQAACELNSVWHHALRSGSADAWSTDTLLDTLPNL